MVRAAALGLLCVRATTAVRAGHGSFSSIVQSSDGTRSSQLAEVGPIVWAAALDAEAPVGMTVELDTTSRRQEIFGFGGAFTEAAGYTFSQLSSIGRAKMLEHYFDPGRGIGYTTGRIAMNSPDFALSHYSYANTSGDTELASFQHDLPRDNEYVLPLLHAALNHTVRPLRLFSAPWSPPAWMKVRAHGKQCPTLLLTRPTMTAKKFV